MQRRDFFGRHAGDRARDRLRAEPGGVDDQRGLEAHRLRPAGLDHDPAVFGPARHDRRRKRHHRAMRLRVAPQRQHERVAVDDAGRGRKDCAFRLERRLEPAGFIAGQPDEIVDAVGPGLRLERREPGGLGRVCRHDQLAAAPMGDAVLAAEIVEQGLALDAEPRFGESGLVIDPGVDDFAVA